MTTPERALRLLFIPGQVHAEDFTFSRPVAYELVSINNVERIRRYYITSTRTKMPFDRLGCFRKRADTVRRWNRLTGERLTNDLEPVTSERRES